MNFAFFTYCEDKLQERFGTQKLIHSLKFYHSNYNIILYGSKEIESIYKEYNVNYSNALPCFLLDAKRKNNLDYIIHIDSDSVCLGYLDLLLNFDYEIAAQLNNPFIGDRDERQNRPQELWNLSNSKYVSPGCISTNSEKFLLDWIELNGQITKTYGGVKAFWMADINTMNILFHYGGYKSKILDPLDGNAFYGPSANLHDKDVKDDPKHIISEYSINSWKSWKKINYNEDDRNFYLYGKLVRLVHQSGGGNAKTAIKCHFSMFNDKTRAKLQEITGINE